MYVELTALRVEVRDEIECPLPHSFKTYRVSEWNGGKNNRMKESVRREELEGIRNQKLEG
jgi:hypothetical protein